MSTINMRKIVDKIKEKGITNTDSLKKEFADKGDFWLDRYLDEYPELFEELFANNVDEWIQDIQLVHIALDRFEKFIPEGASISIDHSTETYEFDTYDKDKFLEVLTSDLAWMNAVLYKDINHVNLRVMPLAIKNIPTLLADVTEGNGINIVHSLKSIAAYHRVTSRSDLISVIAHTDEYLELHPLEEWIEAMDYGTATSLPDRYLRFTGYHDPETTRRMISLMMDIPHKDKE